MAKLNKLTTPQAKMEAIEDLTNLSVSAGWLFLADFIKSNVRELEETIIDPFDVDGKLLYTEDELNQLRHKVKLQKEFIKLPNNLIEKIDAAPLESDVDFDPYN